MISRRRRRAILWTRRPAQVSYSLSENGHDTKVSWLTGKALSNKANIVASKSYNTQSDYRFDMKTFMELRQRPVRNPCLRRNQSHTTDVLLPETALQRPETIRTLSNSPKENSNERIRNDPPF